MDSSLLHCNDSANLERVLLSMVQSVVVESAILAQKSLPFLLFVMGSEPDIMHMVLASSATDRRFPFAELNQVEKPVPENKDASETDEEDGDGDDDQEVDDGSSGEEGTDADDDDEDSEDDAMSDGESDGDEDDDDGNDDDDDEEDDDQDDDEEEDEEEAQPPSKKKK